MKLTLLFIFLSFFGYSQQLSLTNYTITYNKYPKSIMDLYKSQYKVVMFPIDPKWQEGDTIRQNLTIYYESCKNCIDLDVPVDFEKLFLNKQVGLVYSKGNLTLIKLK